MKPSELKKMIGVIVAEEVRKQLPSIAQRVITEQFLRKMISEQVGRQPQSSLREITTQDGEDQDDYTDMTPTALENDDDGIYRENPMFKKNELASRLMSNNNPMSFIYEGIKPIRDGGSSNPSFDDGGIPLKQIAVNGKGLNVQRMKEINERLNKSVNAPMQKSPEAQMRELEQRRKMLDVPAK